MTLKSGWCLDAIQYRALGMDSYADKLHNTCPSQHCPCECHNKEEE